MGKHNSRGQNAESLKVGIVESPTSQARYDSHTYDQKKRSGASYTPASLASFVAKGIVKSLRLPKSNRVRVLDPAVGDGELLLAITDALRTDGYQDIEIYGFDINGTELERAGNRLRQHHQDILIDLKHENFLNHVLEHYISNSNQRSLFQNDLSTKFDVVIANPPYVRTQVLGSDKAKTLAHQFGLTGRVDLYHAFILAISNVLHDQGTMGIIVSNRFMTTKSGASARECFLTGFALINIWDLGDTKLFDEAVLPAVVIAKRSEQGTIGNSPSFASCYTERTSEPSTNFDSVLNALEKSLSGYISVDDIQFKITQGRLDHGSTNNGVWRIQTSESDAWLYQVEKHTFSAFKEIGKIRVGIKTTADKVFIRNDWETLPDDQVPEDGVLMSLITHKQASRWKPKTDAGRPKVLYTHKTDQGKRLPISLQDHPHAANYLEGNRDALEKRKYVINAGREWFEIWVPHNPDVWQRLKLVWRDISEMNTFFMEKEGSVINGDCYWMVASDQKNDELLWLALAVGNSSFILKFYDEKFCNKLYSNRRRFMTQYVDEFPIPDPEGEIGKKLISMSKEIFTLIEDGKIEKAHDLEREADGLVWRAFGLVKE